MNLTDFKGVIGKKLPSDTTLKNMKKGELIELLHIAQHNYDVLMEFYTNAVKVNMENVEKCEVVIKRLAEIQVFSFQGKLPDGRVCHYLDVIEYAKEGMRNGNRTEDQADI